MEKRIVLGKLDIHMQKNETITNFYNWQELIQNGLKTNVSPETIKLLEENTGKQLLDTVLGNDFFGYDT